MKETATKTNGTESPESPSESVRDQIVAWAESQKRPDWQSDAIRRIYQKRKLSQDDGDFHELGLLLRDSFGIPVPLGDLKVERFRFSVGGRGRAASASVQLISMGNLANVNAIAPGTTLPFVDPDPKKLLPPKPSGLVVVYGPNGSGKSGYSRVLKRACYARDAYARGDAGDSSRSPILPNIHNPGDGDAAAAKFVWNIDGEKKAVEWIDGERIADKLGLSVPPLAVFDSHCARAYVSKDNEVVFRPYGLDILEELARVCDILKADVDKEIADVRAELKELRTRSADTEIGEFVNFVWSEKISESAVESAARVADSFSENERGRLADLKSVFAERDPREKAEGLRGQAKRIAEWNRKISGFATSMNDNDFPRRLREAVCGFVEAENEAVKINAADFGGHPPPGIEGKLWETMFKAAEEFAKEIHPDCDFPAMEKCVLCQQPLGDDGRKTLTLLREFLRRGAAKIRDEWKGKVGRCRDDLRKMDLSPDNLLNESLVAEMKGVSAESGADPEGLESRAREFVDALVKRRNSLLLWADSLKCEELPSLPEHPIEEINALWHWANTRASALTEDKRKLESKLKNLEAKKIFADNRRRVDTLIKLRLCADALDSTTITHKAKKLSEKAVNDELTKRVNFEIDRLGRLSGGRRFHTHSRQKKAKQMAKLVLDGDPEKKHDLQDVLSEGEHRAIALACFLAEIYLDPKAVSCIVLDDPVSSLDHARAKKVAQRLLDESQKRQVIVFTHDLHFSNLFSETQVRKIAVREDISASGVAFGVVGEMPFEGRSVKSQIHSLKETARELGSPALSPAERDSMLHSGYRDFRIALTRLAEECLLCGAVARRFPEVKVGKLAQVFAYAKEKEKIARRLKILYGDSSDDIHGPPSESAGVPPSLDQFRAAVEELDEIQKMLAGYDGK